MTSKVGNSITKYFHFYRLWVSEDECHHRVSGLKSMCQNAIFLCSLPSTNTTD